MTLKMPKPVYRIFLAVLMISFVAVACNNKGDKKEEPKDTTVTKPVDPGTMPAAPTGDTVQKKPVDPGT